jgi:hypothetical protein
MATLRAANAQLEERATLMEGHENLCRFLTSPHCCLPRGARTLRIAAPAFASAPPFCALTIAAGRLHAGGWNKTVPSSLQPPMCCKGPAWSRLKRTQMRGASTFIASPLLNPCGVARRGLSTGALEELLGQLEAAVPRVRSLVTARRVAAAAEEAAEELNCRICFTRRKDAALDPCGHMYCRTCIGQLRQGTCPTCRQPTAGYRLVHF